MALYSTETLDVSKTRLKTLAGIASGQCYVSLAADQNELSSLSGVEQLPGLLQLSVRYNKLVNINGVSTLSSLVILNLQGNSITSTAGLEGLTHLQWLNLAGNSIKDTQGLNNCSSLTHLDLSDNCISQVDDLTNLKSLKTLLLHSNAIKSLQHRVCPFPHQLETLTLAENEIKDLNEFASLSQLHMLAQLSVMGNPSTPLSTKGFSYRPYLLWWCEHLTVLDGSPVSTTEQHEAKVLFSDTSYRTSSHPPHSHYSTYQQTVHAGRNHSFHLHPPQPDSSLSYTDTTNDQSFSSTSSRGVSTSSSRRQPQVMETLKALRYVQEMIQSQEHVLLQQSTPNTHQEVLRQLNYLGDNDGGGQRKDSKEAAISGTTIQAQVGSNPPSLCLPQHGSSDSSSSTPTLCLSQSPPSNWLSGGEQADKYQQQQLEKGGQKEEDDDDNSGSLQSTSSFLPVLNNSFEDHSVAPPTTSTFSSLASSLSHAYGYPQDSNGVLLLTDLLLSEKEKEEEEEEVTRPVTLSERDGKLVEKSSLENQKLDQPSTAKDGAHATIEDQMKEEEEDKEEGEEHRAAVLIQSCVRGYLCRKHGHLARHRAATLIQSVWRGYHARKTNPVVVSACDQLHRRKMENFITLLFSQLLGCREELAYQANLLQIQEESMQSLMREVEVLQQFKAEQERVERQKAACTIQKHWRRYCSRKRNRAIDGHSSFSSTYNINATASLLHSLTWNCLSLQKKVQSLQDQVSKLTEQASFHAFVPPLPPTNLTMDHHSHTCLLLQWSPPAVDPNTLRGYQVYVNGLPEGMIAPHKHKAYIEGLDMAVNYRITVRAVYSNNMESVDSNAVMASLTAVPTSCELTEQLLTEVAVTSPCQAGDMSPILESRPDTVTLSFTEGTKQATNEPLSPSSPSCPPLTLSLTTKADQHADEHERDHGTASRSPPPAVNLSQDTCTVGSPETSPESPEGAQPNTPVHGPSSSLPEPQEAEEATTVPTQPMDDG